MDSSHSSLTEEDEIDLRELFSTLRKYKKSIIFITLMITLFSVIFAYFKTDIYESTATLEIQERKSTPKGDLVTESLIMGDIGGVNLDTEMEVIKSRFLISKAISLLNMSHHYYILEKLKRIEFYKNSPFSVKMKKGFDIEFELKPISESSFRYYLNLKMRMEIA